MNEMHNPGQFNLIKSIRYIIVCQTDNIHFPGQRYFDGSIIQFAFITDYNGFQYLITPGTGNTVLAMILSRPGQ